MLLLFMLAHIGICFADLGQDTQVFDQANKLYVQGAYESALAEYQTIPNKTGTVWYNMGNAAYQQKDYTHALLYWLRAQKYGDAHVYKEACNSLHRLASQAGSIENGLNHAIVYFGTLSLKKIPVYVWQLLFLLIWYLLCWCLMKKYRCSAIKSGILAVLLFLTSIPIMIGYYIDKEQVIVVDSADLYNGPNNALYKVGTVQKNKIATLLDVKKQWYKVSHDGIIGWVERKSVAKI